MNINITTMIEAEFQRVRKSQQRQYLVLSEVVRFRLPPSLPSLDFQHLGTLYLLNTSGNGRFTLGELQAFAHFCMEQQGLHMPHEFRSRLEGLGMLKIWHDIEVHGPRLVESWVLALVCSAAPRRRFKTGPRATYVDRHSIVPVYKVFRGYLTEEVTTLPPYPSLLCLSSDLLPVPPPRCRSRTSSTSCSAPPRKLACWTWRTRSTTSMSRCRSWGCSRGHLWRLRTA
jgi:hypothetical protein